MHALKSFIMSQFTAPKTPQLTQKQEKPKYPLALTPFVISGGSCFSSSNYFNEETTEQTTRDVLLALQDPSDPDTTTRLLDNMFAASQIRELNEFIRLRDIEVRAIGDKVIENLKAKGITLTLAGDGKIKTITMTAGSMITAVPVDHLRAAINQATPLPSDVSRIIADYSDDRQLRITAQNIRNYGGILGAQKTKEQWEAIFVATSNQEKVHALSTYFSNRLEAGHLELQNLNLTVLNLPGIQISQVDFINVDFSKVDFTGARFIDVNFINSPIRSTTNLTGAKISRVTFIDSPIESGTVAARIIVRNSTFKNSPIRQGVDLDGAIFENVTLKNSKIEAPCPTPTKPKFTGMKGDTASLPLPK